MVLVVIVVYTRLLPLHVGWKYVNHVQLGSSCSHWFLVPGIEKKSDKRCKIGVHLLDDCMMKKFCKEYHGWTFDEDESPNSKLSSRGRGVRNCRLPRVRILHCSCYDVYLFSELNNSLLDILLYKGIRGITYIFVIAASQEEG